MLTLILLVIIGFIIWKFTEKAKPPHNPSSKAIGAKRHLSSPKGRDYQNIEYDENGWVHIQKPFYFGQYSRSPNGRFSIAWSQFDPEGYGGSFKEIGSGPYFLLRDQEILIQGQLERPNDGKVADNGTFIVNDWMLGEGLKGTFYAFSATGDVLMKQSVRANLYNNGISNDGHYACFQTCNTNDKHPDGNTFFVFDLVNKVLINKFSPITGWANNYYFDTCKQILYFNYKNGISYRYNFDGQCLDEDKWLRDREETASGYLALELAAEKLTVAKSQNFADYCDIILLLEKAGGENISPHAQAKVKRIYGEINLNCGDKTKAIQYFEEALAINEKVGVKKLLQKLKAEQSS